MLASSHFVDVSRAQFAFTALFHFLFVPLTLGLTWVVMVMEAAYLKTGKIVYRDMTKFWAKLLAINFAMGVVTGITLEFEFGQNWAYFSRMIGGSFGPILAIEGITAFMLEATMFGLFYFTWDKVSKGVHFFITVLMAVGASLSIVNILAANSWMQHPVASSFDPITMAMNLRSIAALYLAQLAQVRVGHVAYAGFLTGSMFVMGISAYYLLRNRDLGFAKRSFAVGAGFGICSLLMVAFYGDQNGLQVAKNEPEKMAAIEAQWETQKAPAAWYLIAFPHQKSETNSFVIKIPYALSLIATHSLTGVVPGEKEVMASYIPRVKRGIEGYQLLSKIRHEQENVDHVANISDVQQFDQYVKDIGFGFLAKRYNPSLTNVTSAQISQTVKKAIPNVAVCFWSFRIMIGVWGLMLLGTVIGLIKMRRGTLSRSRWYLWCMLLAIPLPWIAAEFGWVLAEVGRQPWVVHEILPTFMGVSSVPFKSVVTSLSGYVLFYCFLVVIELFLMFKYARLGPSSLHTGRYHFEKQQF